MKVTYDESAIDTSTKRMEENKSDGIAMGTSTVSNDNDDIEQKRKCKPYWKHPNENLSEEKKKRMVAECIAVMCRIIMNNHV